MRRVSLLFILILLLSLLLLWGCSPDSSENGDVDNQVDEPEMQEFTLYFMKTTPTDFKLVSEKRTVEAEEITPELVARELLRGPEDQELDRVIPEETELRDISIENNTVFVSFSRSLVEASYGAQLESILIDSLVYSFTEIEGIDSLQILVEDEIVESLGGHIVINSPLSR